MMTMTIMLILVQGLKLYCAYQRHSIHAWWMTNKKRVKPDFHQFTRLAREAQLPFMTRLGHALIYIWNYSCVLSLKSFSGPTESWKKSWNFKIFLLFTSSMKFHFSLWGSVRYITILFEHLFLPDCRFSVNWVLNWPICHCRFAP